MHPGEKVHPVHFADNWCRFLEAQYEDIFF
jgi:hypothetical protein